MSCRRHSNLRVHRGIDVAALSLIIECNETACSTTLLDHNLESSQTMHSPCDRLDRQKHAQSLLPILLHPVRGCHEYKPFDKRGPEAQPLQKWRELLQSPWRMWVTLIREKQVGR